MATGTVKNGIETFDPLPLEHGGTGKTSLEALAQMLFTSFEVVHAQNYNDMKPGLVYNQGVGTNCPTGNGYILVLTLCAQANTPGCQFGIDMYSNTPKLYYRTRTAGIWRAWVTLA